MRRAGVAGLTLIEAVVALALLAINVVGWSAGVQLIALLLQRTAALLATLETLDLAGMCSLGLLGARPSRAQWPRCSLESARSWGQLRSCGRPGFSLIEVLVALAVSGLVFTLLAAGFVSTARFTRTALGSGDAATVRAALPTMLRQAVEVAGRGVTEGCALAVDATGEWLGVTFSVAGGAPVVDEVFAALDGGGRPALYLRRVPHPRQPWLENVTSFRVLDYEMDAGGRVAIISLALDHVALSDPLAVRVLLPHRPCLEVAP